jgi:VIT1/CCC1 family predicted Fe2+/Mn2+ transporter
VPPRQSRPPTGGGRGPNDEGSQPPVPEPENLGKATIDARAAAVAEDTSEVENLGPATASTDEDAREESEISEAVSQRRESTRGILAAGLLGLLGVLVVAAPVLLATNQLSGDEVESLAQLILTPLVGLVGSVIGFYFGGVTAESRPKKGPPKRKGKKGQ